MRTSSSTPSQPVVVRRLVRRPLGLQLELQEPLQDLRVAVRAPVLEEARQHAAQEPHGALGPLAVAAEPEQVVGGAAEQVAAGAAQMHLAHAGARGCWAPSRSASPRRSTGPCCRSRWAASRRSGRRRGGPGRPAGCGSRLGRDHVGAQRVGRRHEALAVEGGRGRERDRLDRDPAVRLGGEALLQLAARWCGQRRRGRGSATARPGRCGRWPRRTPSARAPPGPRRQRRACPASGRHVGQQRRLAEHAPEQVRRRTAPGRGSATTPLPGRLTMATRAAARGLHQARDAGEPAARQVQRVHEVARLLGDDEIDPLQPVQRLQVDLVVADGEVAALDHRVAQIAGEVGVAEVGRARRPRAQEHDPAVVAPAQAWKLSCRPRK